MKQTPPQNVSPKDVVKRIRTLELPRSKVAELWYHFFEKPMESELGSRELSDCIIALVDRVARERDLYELTGELDIIDLSCHGRQQGTPKAILQIVFVPNLAGSGLRLVPWIDDGNNAIRLNTCLRAIDFAQQILEILTDALRFLSSERKYLTRVELFLPCEQLLQPWEETYRKMGLSGSALGETIPLVVRSFDRRWNEDLSVSEYATSNEVMAEKWGNLEAGCFNATSIPWACTHPEGADRFESWFDRQAGVYKSIWPHPDSPPEFSELLHQLLLKGCPLCLFVKRNAALQFQEIDKIRTGMDALLHGNSMSIQDWPELIKQYRCNRNGGVTVLYDHPICNIHMTDGAGTAQTA